LTEPNESPEKIAAPPKPLAERRRVAFGRLSLGMLLAVLLLGLGWLLFQPSASPGVASANGPLTWHTSPDAALARATAERKLLHVQFSRAGLPLSRSMEETLRSAPVAQLARAHFVNLRLDSQANAELFQRWVGSAGALASCILEVRTGAEGPDVLAVLPGFADAERYLSFLDAAAKSAPRLRWLRDEGKSSFESLLELGDIYSAQGSARRARESFASVAAPVSGKARALERLARLNLEAGRIVDARRTLQEARALDHNPTAPAMDRLALTEALLLSSERRVSAAVSLLERLAPTLPAGPERDRAWFTLGTLQHEQKRDADALASLERLLRESRLSPWARRADEHISHIKNPGPTHTH